MKTRTTFAALVLALSLFVIRHSSFAQGALTPPGAPAPTMKTLTQIEPRTPISSLPYTITSPGSYYLTTNLTSSGTSHGITISSGNVTVDLNGFALQGIYSSAWSGIYVTGSYTNLVFRNGTVSGWAGSGIDTFSAAFPRNMLFEHLTVSGNYNGIYTEAGSVIRDCLAYANNSSGFDSVGGEITGCFSKNNGSDGFDLSNGSLRNCRSENNFGLGFNVNNARVLDCDSYYNQATGIYCTGNGNEIRRCRIMGNSNTGIFFDAYAGSYVITDCEIANNTYSGIYSHGGSSSGGAYIARNNLTSNGSGGIILNDNNNYIEDNHVLTPSGQNGIAVNGTNCVVARNVVMGAGAINYSIYFQDDAGPIGSASSATSPWANISH